METIPNELLFEVLLKIKDINDVINICSTNKTIKAICDNEIFWKSRFELDYPNLKISPSSMKITYKQAYQSFYLTGIANKLRYPVIYDGTPIGFIKPEGPYKIIKVFTPKFTELGGIETYMLMPDIIMSVMSNDSLMKSKVGQWRTATYPRTHSFTGFNGIRQTDIKYFISEKEAFDYISSLIAKGFYQMTDKMMTSNEVENLNKMGYLLSIDEVTDIRDLYT